MDRITEQVSIGARCITVRELTLGEIRVWLAQAETRAEEPDWVGELLFEDAPLSAVTAMTDLSLDDMADFSPSDLRTVVTCCKRVNPHFFGLARRLKAVNDRLAELLVSSVPPPSSCAPDTPTSGPTPGASTPPH